MAVTTSFFASTDTWTMPISETDPPPQWVSDRLCAPEKQEASQRLAHALSGIAETRDLTHLTQLQKTGLRVSVVHEWRRLVLRVPPLPDRLFSDRWRGPDCRRLTAAILTRLPAPPLGALEADVSGTS